MAIENKQEVIDWLKAEDNKNFLGENGFNTEVPAKITDELVTKFIGDNQGYRDKLHNSIETDFLKRKTGLEEIKPEMLGEKLMFESGVKNNNETYKKALIAANMSNVKNSELLMTQIDATKIEFKDGKLEGFGEQLDGLRTKYPDMFNTGETPPKNTPPAKTTTTKTNLTYEQFVGMSASEKKNVSDADLQRISEE